MASFADSYIQYKDNIKPGATIQDFLASTGVSAQDAYNALKADGQNTTARADALTALSPLVDVNNTGFSTPDLMGQVNSKLPALQGLFNPGDNGLNTAQTQQMQAQGGTQAVQSTEQLNKAQAGVVPTATRQPAPTVQPLSAQEMAQNQIAEQAYQQRLAAMGGVGMAPGAQPAQQTAQATPQSGYTGGSIVDYLNSIGQNSSFSARKAIAAQNGISGYTGSATQNTQLLNALRSMQGTTVSPALTAGATTAQSSQGGAVGADGTINGQPANPADQYPASTKAGVGSVDNSPNGVIDLYTKIVGDLGAMSFKKLAEDNAKQITDLDNKIADEKATINDNPWLTEGERVIRNRKIDEKNAQRRDTLVNQQTMNASLYEKSIQQAQFLTGQIMTEQHNQAVLDAQAQQNAIENAQKALDAQNKLEGPQSVQEYQYAVKQGYQGSYIDYQNEDANRKISIAKAGVAGLSPSQINSTVNSIAGAFDNEPLVREYNTIKRNVDTFNNLGTSATDDIQRVYTFAKVADPNSAVKEGEYNSIEKYAQAVLQRVGLKVSRVFSSTGILTPEARTAMSNTLNTSLQASQRAYDQVASEYQRQINDAYSGSPRQITNYTGTTGTTNTSNLTDEQAYQVYLKSVQAPTTGGTQSSTPTTASRPTVSASSLISNLTKGYQPLKLGGFF